MPVRASRKHRHYIGNWHYSECGHFRLFPSVCAKRFHRHYSGQPALLRQPALERGLYCTSDFLSGSASGPIAFRFTPQPPTPTCHTPRGRPPQTCSMYCQLFSTTIACCKRPLCFPFLGDADTSFSTGHLIRNRVTRQPGCYLQDYKKSGGHYTVSMPVDEGRKGWSLLAMKNEGTHR